MHYRNSPPRAIRSRHNYVQANLHEELKTPFGFKITIQAQIHIRVPGLANQTGSLCQLFEKYFQLETRKESNTIITVQIRLNVSLYVSDQ